MDKLSNSNDLSQSNGPSPADFDNFLPWACNQLEVDVDINITRIEQDSFSKPTISRISHRISARVTEPITFNIKAHKSTTKGKDGVPDADHPPTRRATVFDDSLRSKVVNIHTVYDQNQRLVQIQFIKNTHIPTGIIKIISLIIQFYPGLTAFKTDGGINKDGLYELSKILSLSKITEITLDNNVLREANYYLLLEENTNLKYLSLARCKINDAAVKLIASKLLTSHLSILNLTSNRITDEGAAHLANVLRINRKLTYLNIADNGITDVGAIEILNCLMPFALNSTEVIGKKIRHFTYLRQKHDLVLKLVAELRLIELESEKKASKKTATKTVAPSKKKSKNIIRESSARLLPQNPRVVNPTLLNKAEEKASSSLGPFKDPFGPDNTVTKSGTVYCLGNNSLCYLNLAYNNLTYFTVKKLYDVVIAQYESKRVPRGLINVCIDGNNMPEACPEMTEIDYYLQVGLASKRFSAGMPRKRTTLKLSPKLDIRSKILK